MRREIIFGLVALIYVFSSAYSGMAERRVALVIGNSAYKHAGELANPKNDAADIVTALKKLSSFRERCSSEAPS